MSEFDIPDIWTLVLRSALARLYVLASDRSAISRLMEMGWNDYSNDDIPSNVALGSLRSADGGTDSGNEFEVALLFVRYATLWTQLRELSSADPDIWKRKADRIASVSLHSALADQFILAGTLARLFGVYIVYSNAWGDWCCFSADQLSRVFSSPGQALEDIFFNVSTRQPRFDRILLLARLVGISAGFPVVSSVNDRGMVRISIPVAWTFDDASLDVSAIVESVGDGSRLGVSLAVNGEVNDALGRFRLNGSLSGVMLEFGVEAPKIDFRVGDLRGNASFFLDTGALAQKSPFVDLNVADLVRLSLRTITLRVEAQNTSVPQIVFEFSLLGGLVDASVVQLCFAAVRFSVGVRSGVRKVSFCIEQGNFCLSQRALGRFLNSLFPGDLSLSFELQSTFADGAADTRGGIELEKTIGVAGGIGPLQFRALRLLGRGNQNGVDASIVASISINMGPLLVEAQGVGLLLAIAPITQGPGNLGVAEAVARAVPPTCLAICIAADLVSGRGGISYDDSTGRYVGLLSLSIGEVALHAVGILDTRVPGIDGYSFLIAISAEFAPVQLGMGFTLNGVGGICGIQRSVSSRALLEGVRNGSLAPLLFPRDPVGQASQLVTGLQRIFPPTQDRYVFGPMFKIGWGTPTLVTVDLGIVIQLPSPVVIALIGQIAATLPSVDAAVVVLHIDIVGTLDTGEKTLAIDASLRDSRIATFTLTGDMAVRLSWGERSDFALSIGGFNKAFKPPPGFPELRRLTLALCEGTNPRITLAAYLALTSNSFQFGARAELYAEAAGFNVYGYLEFNALIIFTPFSFRFDFAAGLALRRGTTAIMAISVIGMLSGPTPWHVQGSASISIVFFEISVSFDQTFGQHASDVAVETVDLWPQLQREVQDPRNWIATLPLESNRVVSFATPVPLPSGETPLRLDPLGDLSFRQKTLPLNHRITKFGEKRVAGPTRFNLAQTCQIGTTATTSESLQGNFAAGQFQQLTDAEKLSRPSFELMDAGASFAAGAVKAYAPRETNLTYNTIRVDGTETQTSVGVHTPGNKTLSLSFDSSAVGLAPLRTAGNKRFAPPTGKAPLVALDDEEVVIVNASTMRRAEFAVRSTSSQGDAHEALRQRLLTHPEERGTWRVVPTHEAR